MRRYLPFIAALALYAVTPLAAEVTENVVHLLVEGHLAHADPDAHGSDEHGCSGTFHVCACHQAVSLASEATECAAPPAESERACTPAPPGEARALVDEVFRPPIA